MVRVSTSVSPGAGAPLRGIVLGALASLALFSSCGMSYADVDSNGDASARLEGRLVSEPGADVPMYGGPGLKDARTVEAWALHQDGRMTMLGSAAVEDGRYALDVLPADEVMVVRALDGNGQVKGQVLVEGKPAQNRSRTVQPMTVWSSVQAAVLIDLYQHGKRAPDFDQAGLRLRIDPATASRVKETAAVDPARAQAEVHAIALATWSAHLATKKYLDSRNVSFEDWQKARAQVAVDLDAEMDGGLAKSESCMQMRSEMKKVNARFGLDAEAMARAETRAASAARFAIAALSNQGMDTSMHAYGRLSAESEARLAAAALVELLERAHASGQTKMKAQQLNESLLMKVAGANQEDELADAWKSWRRGVRGEVVDFTIQPGLLAEVWGQLKGDAYAATLAQLNALERRLATQLQEAAEASIGYRGELEAENLAFRTDAVWNEFEAEANTRVRSMLSLGEADEQLIVSLLMVAEGSAR